MNICIIGDGIVSRTLAKTLTNKKINVDLYHQKKIINLKSSRTIGIAQNNYKFLTEEVYKFKKNEKWEINKIAIYSEKKDLNEILNFNKKNNKLFYMVKNNSFYQALKKKLIKNKYFKQLTINKNNFYTKLLKEKKYDLIINCDPNNYLSKKYFSRKIEKDYNNLSFTTILEHDKIDNNTAIQIFTKYGPIAFLPISNIQTSVVYSLEIKNKNFSNQDVLNLIKNNNLKYKIKKVFKLESFKIKSSNLRNYYSNNILAFGDLLHRIHPLAGQGFNMTVRDIKILSEIIQNKIDLGLQLDSLIFEEFEKKTKHLNFVFSNGIDLIYELFNKNKNHNDENLNKILKYLGKKININSTFIKLADNGLNI